VGGNQRSRLLALGSLNLTAETSRWVHGCENLAKGVAWRVTRQRTGFWRLASTPEELVEPVNPHSENWGSEESLMRKARGKH
jgi:hypothetical protein